MELRFGYDFSQVRMHTDAWAAQSAHAVKALAYTVGRKIFMGTGQFQPQSKAGQRLLAHEKGKRRLTLLFYIEIREAKAERVW